MLFFFHSVSPLAYHVFFFLLLPYVLFLNARFDIRV